MGLKNFASTVFLASVSLSLIGCQSQSSSDQTEPQQISQNNSVVYTSVCSSLIGGCLAGGDKEISFIAQTSTNSKERGIQNSTFSTPIFAGKQNSNSMTRSETNASDISIYTIEVVDGKILVGGQFSSVNGSKINSFVVLNQDGTINDISVKNPLQTNGEVYTATVSPDGSFLLGGYFTQINDIACNGVAKLDKDGTLIDTFEDLRDEYENLVVDHINVSQDKIILSGMFFDYNKNITGLIALNTDGTLDENLTKSMTVFGHVFKSVQFNDKTYSVGQFKNIEGKELNIISFNANGTISSNFDLSEELAGYIFDIEPIGSKYLALGGNFSFSENNDTKNVVFIDGSGQFLSNIRVSSEGDVYDISDSENQIVITGESTINSAESEFDKVAVINKSEEI